LKEAFFLYPRVLFPCKNKGGEFFSLPETFSPFFFERERSRVPYLEMKDSPFFRGVLPFPARDFEFV